MGVTNICLLVKIFNVLSFHSFKVNKITLFLSVLEVVFSCRYAAVERTQESVHFHCPSSCHRAANCCGLSLNKPGICRLQMLISGKNFSYRNIRTLVSLSALFPPFRLYQLVCKMLIHCQFFSVTCPVRFFIYISVHAFLYL